MRIAGPIEQFRNRPGVQDVKDPQLDKLSLKELRELKDSIDTAIRAAIRQRSEFKAKPARSATADPIKIDLEGERDAWIAARRQAKPV
jgi:hypothetical protein